MRALSGDLWVRLVQALDRGMSARAAALLLEVSAADGFDRTGRGWRSPCYLLEGERDWLLARIEQKKDLTLHELLAELREKRGGVVCCDTLWRSGTGFYQLFKGFSCADFRWLRRRRKPAVTRSAA